MPVIFCNLFVFFDVLLCTTSIWHLTILSIDRFLHISCPFRSRERSKRKTFLTILSIWTFSIAISCIILILGCIDEKNILIIINDHRRYCALNNRSFIIYGSIVCFCIPCTLMLVTYSLTIRRLQLEAAKGYSDSENRLKVKQLSSDRLRRHRLSSRRQQANKTHNHYSPKELSTSSPAFPHSPTITDTENAPNSAEQS